MNERQAVSDYTPTTKEVRESFYIHTFNRDMEHLRAEAFDRWLAAHDAEIRGVDPVALDVLAEQKAMAYHDSECLLRPEIRTAALEEAAEIAEGELFWDPRGEVLSSDEVAYNVACREVSRAIRATKDGAQ